MHKYTRINIHTYIHVYIYILYLCFVTVQSSSASSNTFLVLRICNLHHLFLRILCLLELFPMLPNEVTGETTWLPGQSKSLSLTHLQSSAVFVSYFPPHFPAIVHLKKTQILQPNPSTLTISNVKSHRSCEEFLHCPLLRWCINRWWLGDTFWNTASPASYSGWQNDSKRIQQKKFLKIVCGKKNAQNMSQKSGAL